MSGRVRPRRSAPWLAALRMLLRYGLPLAGILVVGRAVVLSVGGDIARWRFALGIVLMAAGFSARLVPGDVPKSAQGKAR